MKLSLGHLCNYFSKLLNPICKGFVCQLAIRFVSMFTRDSFEAVCFWTIFVGFWYSNIADFLKLRPPLLCCLLPLWQT